MQQQKLKMANGAPEMDEEMKEEEDQNKTFVTAVK